PSEAKVSELTELNGFAMGCPAMGCEVLEETEMEPFVSEVESIIKEKKIVLFGSYGWGDGQWMRDWEDRMKSAGAIIFGGEGIIAHEMPQDDDIERCKDIGKQLAEL
ncbi:MAG: flavodoxin, partial [Bacilli bacterium]|nr:flavodoxin [Bacilli bacterium]